MSKGPAKQRRAVGSVMGLRARAQWAFNPAAEVTLEALVQQGRTDAEAWCAPRSALRGPQGQRPQGQPPLQKWRGRKASA